MTTMTRGELARMIDHTLLVPEATDEDVTRLAKEADQLGVWAICISPSRLPVTQGVLDPGIAVAAVAGFPSGAHQTAVKVAEAGGASFVKTSTGFHPAGGATVQAVAAMAAAILDGLPDE
ncbi:MAG: hypothetical protein ABSA93_24285 [Streptosporangiaceae bacterium]|jgi:deoxyribose-phosphate aldolase